MTLLNLAGTLLYHSQAQPNDDNHTDAYSRPPASGGEVAQLADVEDTYNQSDTQVSQFPNGDLCVTAGAIFGAATAREALRIDLTTDPPTYSEFITDLLSGGIGNTLIRGEMDSTGRLIMVVSGNTGTWIRRFNTDGTVEATYNPAYAKQIHAAAISPDGQYVYIAYGPHSGDAGPTVTLTVTQYDLDNAGASSTFYTNTLSTQANDGVFEFPGAALGTTSDSVFIGYVLHTYAGNPTFRDSYAFWIDQCDTSGTVGTQYHVSSLDYTGTSFSNGQYSPDKGFGALLNHDSYGGTERMWGWAWDLQSATEALWTLDINIVGASATLHNYFSGSHPQPARANLYVPIWPYVAGGGAAAGSRVWGIVIA